MTLGGQLEPLALGPGLEQLQSVDHLPSPAGLPRVPGLGHQLVETELVDVLEQVREQLDGHRGVGSASP